MHSHSYTGNPLACRAALATLAIFEEDQVLLNNQKLAAHMAAALKPLAAHPAVSGIRQCGMIAAFEVAPKQADGFSRRFFAAALEQEVLLRPIGRTVYWMPPYVVTQAELDLLGERTLAVVNALA